MSKWIVTSAWPYSSDVPHLGNLIGSILSADVAARFLRLQGHSVLLVSGSDEHGTPVEIEALKKSIPVKEFADRNHRRISELFRRWNISYDNYTRTENPVHIRYVQDHYMKIYANGYIFEQDEYVHYCPRDKKFLPDRFVEGICPNCGAEGARGDQCDACGRPLDAVKLINPYCVICRGPTEVRSSKQWFLDLPKMEKAIRQHLEGNKEFSENVVRFSLSWLTEGLKPRSLTRETSWGIPAPFPGAEGRTIYVWMEAVLGYISATIEYFEKRGEEQKWKEFWFDPETKTSFFIGKDNIPFHAIILTGLLLASQEGYTLPGVINSTEFLQFEGKKFSKSRRIGIWIDEALELMPEDYWRYTLLSLRPETGDVNLTFDMIIEKVNSDLNDTIGNFVNRTLSLIQRSMEGRIQLRPQLSPESEKLLEQVQARHNSIAKTHEAFKIQHAVKLTLEQAQEGNRHLNATEPWRLFKSQPHSAIEALYVAARIMKAISMELYPIIPSTAEKIWSFMGEKDDLASCRWHRGTEDFTYPVVIQPFTPLFRKYAKEEIISRLQEIRSKEGR